MLSLRQETAEGKIQGARLFVCRRERGKLERHRACRRKLSHLRIQLRRLPGIVRVWIFDKDVDGLPQLGHRRYGISLFIVHIGQKLEERDADVVRRPNILATRIRPAISLVAQSLRWRGPQMLAER